MHLPFKESSKILEVGGGSRPAFRPNIDIRPLSEVDIVADLNQKWPINNDEFDGLYSSYNIEHISWRKLKHFIHEMYRVIKPNGIVFIITANFLEQCKILVSKDGDWSDDDQSRCWGDQNYDNDNWIANSHHLGLAPKYVIKLFNEVGFKDVAVTPHPNCNTDLIIEARKTDVIMNSNKEQIFNRHYFDGARGGYGGYLFYYDSYLNWLKFDKLRYLNPESVLELGCGRGYVLKHLEDIGIIVQGLDISQHCFLTRAINNVKIYDITKTPWPFEDKSFDICFSDQVLELIPETELNQVLSEMERVSRRGIHGIDIQKNKKELDKTRNIIKPLNWWREHNNQQQFVDTDYLTSGSAVLEYHLNFPKLNCGSFTTMFGRGWLNIDQHPLQQYADTYKYNFIQCDLKKRIPVDDNRAGDIVASHFLEHLSIDDGIKFLNDCWRALVPGGTIRIAVPDAQKLTTMYQNNQLDYFNEINDNCANTNLQSLKLYHLLFDNHLALYDAKSLISTMKEVGFTKVRQMPFRESRSSVIKTETIDMLPDLSLYVEATKLEI